MCVVQSVCAHLSVSFYSITYLFFFSQTSIAHLYQYSLFTANILLNILNRKVPVIIYKQFYSVMETDKPHSAEIPQTSFHKLSAPLTRLYLICLLVCVLDKTCFTFSPDVVCVVCVVGVRAGCVRYRRCRGRVRANDALRHKVMRFRFHTLQLGTQSGTRSKHHTARSQHWVNTDHS